MTMQNVRRRIKALERSAARNGGPEVFVVQRNPVTGKWISAEGTFGDPARCIVVLHSDAAPDPHLVIDAQPRIIGMSAQ